MSRRMRSSLSLRTRFSLVGSCNGAGAGGFCAPINSSRTRQVRHSAAIRCSAYQGELRGSRIGRHKDAAEGRRLAACDVVWGRVGVDLEIFTASVWLFSHSLARGKPPLRCPRHAHSTRLVASISDRLRFRAQSLLSTPISRMPPEWLPFRCRSSTTMMMAGVRRQRAFPRSSRTRRTRPSARATALVARPIGLASSSTKAVAVRRHRVCGARANSAPQSATLSSSR